MTNYNIYMNNIKVGTAEVEPQGLYTLFRCRCSFHKTATYRIHAQFGTTTIDLGVCVPANGSFLKRTKIATKKLNSEMPRFYAINADIKSDKFVPIDPLGEFEYISKLDTGEFCIRDLERGIVFHN